MLNLTCRQTFSFTQARPTLSGKERARAVELQEAADARPMPAPRSSALRCYASAAQDMHSRACGVCMPEAAGVRSLSAFRAARERLPSGSARELVRSSPREL